MGPRSNGTRGHRLREAGRARRGRDAAPKRARREQESAAEVASGHAVHDGAPRRLGVSKGGDAGSCRASGERIKGRVAELGDYRPHVARTKAKLGRNTNGQSVAVEVVQWQDGSTDVGDSNCVMQGMNDGYLYQS
ncbi:hypothetical protein C8035_v000252 [Colletotrichum spinosum]|uniref:Uncharacterized protein n=1 Tax=Colletotrichum spinosum TaxID=1347390 RepID=A0A4R8PLG4_9PEZI|nr:hypothetical protein C8035_v000252 [Colletotrichum spinosum]